jgi:hypothetical protein
VGITREWESRGDLRYLLPIAKVLRKLGVIKKTAALALKLRRGHKSSILLASTIVEIGKNPTV